MKTSHSLPHPFLPHGLFAMFFLLAPPGCEPKAAPGASVEAGAASSAAAPIASSGVAAPVDSVALVTGTDPLMGRLSREARERPKVEPTADEVLATLEKLGEKMAAKQQSLGDTYKANYCVGGYTVDGAFALGVCEYSDPAAAIAGRDLSKKILAKVTTRDVWSHKDDTLSIVQLKDDEATTAKKKKLVGAFLAM